MSAKKSTSTPSEPQGPVRGDLRARRKFSWGWVFAVIAAAGLGAGWYLAWQKVREAVARNEEYRLDPTEDIFITPPPPWIKADVKGEVIRDASLDTSLSILQEDLTKRMAQAFAAHPWVAGVQVYKHYPARVDVELVYRQPVAMVDVPNGIQPVDAAGYVLPGRDFPPELAAKYPRISGIKTAASPEGTEWDDPRVKGSAKIAAEIGSQWFRLRLARIVPAPNTVASRGDDFQYELYTRGKNGGMRSGTRVLWGHAPGAEIRTERPAEEKLNWLLDYVAQNNGSLEKSDGTPQQFDVRGPAMRVEAKTPIRPLPLEDPVAKRPRDVTS